MSEFFRYLFRQIGVNVLIVVAIIVAAYLAMARGEITITKGILLTIFGSLTAISFYRLFLLVSSGSDSLGVQRSPTTIDGSISGWKITTTSALLLLACLFSVATLFIYYSDPKNDEAKNEIKKPEKHSASKSAGSLIIPDTLGSNRDTSRSVTGTPGSNQ